MTKNNWIKNELNILKSKGLLIKLKTVDSGISSKIKVDGKWVLNFSSNNYLGLANDKRLKNAAKKAIDKFGVGPAAVRTISGNLKLHETLEKKLAKFKKVDDVITLQSGFTANLAVIPSITSEGDLIFSDELNHASIIDACKLSKAKVIRYKHLDTDDLEHKLALNKNVDKKIIVTDGVFSMDGDTAPLTEIVKISKKYNAITMVDDAHGEGVLGTYGRGIVDHFKLHGKVDIEVGTLSKAFGVVGGFVAGNKLLIKLLRQKARPFLFSSAMTVPDVSAAIKSVEILENSDKLVKKLWKNTKFFKDKMKDIGFNIGDSVTPITPIMIGDVKLAKELSNLLLKKGIYAKAIGYPTVPMGKARIRVMINASHSKKDLTKALKTFEDVGKKLELII